MSITRNQVSVTVVGAMLSVALVACPSFAQGWHLAPNAIPMRGVTQASDGCYYALHQGDYISSAGGYRVYRSVRCGGLPDNGWVAAGNARGVSITSTVGDTGLPYIINNNGYVQALRSDGTWVAYGRNACEGGTVSPWVFEGTSIAVASNGTFDLPYITTTSVVRAYNTFMGCWQALPPLPNGTLPAAIAVGNIDYRGIPFSPVVVGLDTVIYWYDDPTWRQLKYDSCGPNEHCTIGYAVNIASWGQTNTAAPQMIVVGTDMSSVWWGAGTFQFWDNGFNWTGGPVSHLMSPMRSTGLNVGLIDWRSQFWLYY